MTQGDTRCLRSFWRLRPIPHSPKRPPAQVVTTDAVSGVSFFAGEVDDPFFFDIPAFAGFVTSVLAGAADPTLFDRSRDTFRRLQHHVDRL